MTTTAALCFWAMAVNRFFSSVTRVVRDHIIRRRPVAGEDDHCSGDRQQSPKDFLSAAYVHGCAAARGAHPRGGSMSRRITTYPDQ